MGGGDWRTLDPKYDVSHLVTDTLALLTPQTPIIERMETLRRATEYVAKNPNVSGMLLGALQARAARTDANVGLAVFDFGYLAETYKQATWLAGGPLKGAQEVDGYGLVEEAFTLTGVQAMSFALVAMSIDKTHGADRLRQHIAGARNAAKTDASVRVNLANHWPETIAQFQ